MATCIWGVRWLVWLESPLPEKVAGGKFDEACDVCVEEVGGRVRRQKWAFPTHHSVEVAHGVPFRIL